MARFDGITNRQALLETAFGLHVVSGDEIMHSEEIIGTDKQITILQALGDGDTVGWDGIERLMFSGRVLTEGSDYRFHPGHMASDANDSANGGKQAVDPFFPNGLNYSGTANVAVRLPPGQGSGEGAGANLKGIYRCLKVPDYSVDAAGTPTLTGYSYSANPARIAAFMMINRRGLPLSRIDWKAWKAWRDYCEVLITWLGGTVSETPPAALAWQASSATNMLITGTSVAKVGGGNAWNGYVRSNAIGANDTGARGVEFTIRQGATMTGIGYSTNAPSPDSYATLNVAVYSEVGGALKLLRNGNPGDILTIGTWRIGDRMRVWEDGAGGWHIEQNGNAIDISWIAMPALPGGNTPRYAICAAYAATFSDFHATTNSGANDAVFYPTPTKTTATTDLTVKRFEAHLAFLQPTSLQDVLDQICGVSASDWQDDGDLIRFITPEPCLPYGTLPAAGQEARRRVAHRFTIDNVVGRTIKAWEIEKDARWNRVQGKFRDIYTEQFDVDYVYDVRDELRDSLEGAMLVDPGPIDLPNMNRSQAQRLICWLMRIKSDMKWMCSLRGMGDSIAVLPGDVVEVTSALYIDPLTGLAWNNKRFIVLDATDESGEQGADERQFLLQEYIDGLYSDTDTQASTPIIYPPVPDPTLAPPKVVDLAVTETGERANDGTYFAVANIAIRFGGFTGDQYAVAYYRKTGTTQWLTTGQEVTPEPTTKSAVLTVRGLAAVSYDFVVVTTSRGVGASLGIPGSDVFTRSFSGDTEVPSTPTNLVGAAVGITRNRANIDWDDAPERWVAFWRVYNGAGTLLADRVDASTWETDIPSGTTSMTFKIKAVSRAGIESAFSATVTVTPPAVGAPSGVTLTNYKKYLMLAWVSVEGATYEVSTTNAVDGSGVVWTGAAGFHQMKVPLVAGTYTYYVRAVRNGLRSGFISASVVIGPPPAPGGRKTTRTGKGLWLEWTAVEDADYDVATANDGTGIFWKGRGSSTLVPDAIAAVATYTYYIRTVQDGVPGPFASFTYNSVAPAAPTGLTLTRDKKNLVFKWTALDGLDYDISGNGVSAFARMRGGLYVIENVVTQAATYTFYVRAVQDGVAGAYASASCVVAAAAAPTGTSLVRAGRDLVLNWTALDGKDYELSTTNAANGSGVFWRGRGAQWRGADFVTAASSFTYYLRAVEDGVPGTFTAAITITITAPAAPGAAAAPVYDGLQMIWTIPAVAGCTRYNVLDVDTGLQVATDIGREFVQKVSAGRSVYNLKFYAVDESGIVSAASVTQTFTVPAPSAPASLTVSREEYEVLNLTVAPPVTLPDGLEYQFARANDGTQLITRRKDFVVREMGHPVTSRAITRYARAFNLAGLSSGWTQSGAYSVPVPGAPTLTKDTTNSANNFLKVAVSCANRAVVRATIIQVRAFGAGSWPSTAEGTAGTYRVPGAPATVDVDWAVGGTMEFRVAHEDEFSDALGDRQWSAINSHTFPKFNDGALDPSSNFLKKASYIDPIWTGGGIIEWTAAGLVKWSQPIIISGVGTLVSSNGTVTIAANTTGTALAAGQALVAVQTLGATTATLQVITVASYVEPDATSTTVHRRLFSRNADNSLSTYLGQTLALDRIMDARVLIPMLTSFDADFYNLQVTNANIRSLSATKILTDALYGRIVFADKIGSTNFVSYGDLGAHTETVTYQDVVGYALNAARTTLTKTAGTGISSAVARSTRAIQAGQNAYFDFVMPATARPDGWWGLSCGSAPKGASADFMFSNVVGDGGTGSQRIDIYEDGTGGPNFKGVVGFIGGTDTILRIAVEGNQVKYYYKRTTDVAFVHAYTSGKAPSFPLYADVGTYSNGAVFPATTLTARLTDTTGRKLRWQNLVNCTFDSLDDITKTGGAANTHDAGAVSVDAFSFGEDVWIEHKVTALGTNRTLGFTELADTSSSGGFGFKYGAIVDAGNTLVVLYNYATIANLEINAVQVGDVIRVGVESGVFTIRRNGVLKHLGTGISVPGTYRAGVSFYTSGGALKTIRHGKSYARAAGWQAGQNGDIEMSGDLIVDGERIGEGQARSLGAIGENLLYEGNDYGPPLAHKITHGSAYRFRYSDESYNFTQPGVEVQLRITLPEAGADEFANMDSVNRIEITVLNKFGDIVVAHPAMEFRPGGGLTAFFDHGLKYAHPLDEAVYKLRLGNKFGWSSYFYVSQQALTLVAPAAINRRECPLELNISEDTYAGLGWYPPQANAGAQNAQYRLSGSSAWTNGSGLSSTADQTNATVAAYPGQWYEYRICNAGSGSGARYSNIVRWRAALAPQNPGARDAATNATLHHDIPPKSVFASLLSPTSVRLRFLMGDPAGGSTHFNVLRNGSVIAPNVAWAFSYDDSTVTANTTYVYQVQEIRGGYTSPASNPVIVTTPPTLNATDPTNLNSTNATDTFIDLAWLLNGNVGVITVEWKIDDGTYGSGWTVITPTLAAGTTTYRFTAPSPATRYAFRMKAGTSNYSNTHLSYTTGFMPS